MVSFTMPNGFSLSADNMKDLGKLVEALPSLIDSLPDECKAQQRLAPSASPSVASVPGIETPNVLAWLAAHPSEKRMRMTKEEKAQFDGMPNHVAREEAAKARLASEGLDIVEGVAGGSVAAQGQGVTLDLSEDEDLSDALSDGLEEEEEQ